MLKKLREANSARDLEWDPHGKLNLSFRALELGGEVGELLNVIKKIEREKLGLRGSRATREECKEEIADVLICLDLLAMALNVDLEETLVSKFNKTSDKYGLSIKL